MTPLPPQAFGMLHHDCNSPFASYLAPPTPIVRWHCVIGGAWAIGSRTANTSAYHRFPARLRGYESSNYPLYFSDELLMFCHRHPVYQIICTPPQGIDTSCSTASRPFRHSCSPSQSIMTDRSALGPALPAPSFLLSSIELGRFSCNSGKHRLTLSKH